MKIKKTIALIILSVFAFFHANAKEINKNTALKVAANFISGQSDSGLRSITDLKLVYIGTSDSNIGLRSTERPLFFIYNVSGENGFVIVSADDNITPVLAYADEGSFLIENMPDNIKNWLKVYKKEIAYAIDKEFVASDETQQRWESLLRGTGEKTLKNASLSTALWDQLAPYNDLCPTISGKQTVAGCVATAMGILMKYHQWPLQGTGNNTYTTTTEKLSINADFNTIYDWSNMLNTYQKTNDYPQWNTIQGKAVATLIYHAGVATYMDYGVESSGAYERDAINAFINNFSYDKGMYLAYRNLYTLNEWHALLQSELDEKRPLFYGGITSENEGHQFIIDGYNSSNYYHLNWGWSGYANGYYLITSLEPTWQGTGGSKEGEGFSFEQNVVIGLQKSMRGSKFNHEFFFPVPQEWGFDEINGLSIGLSTDVDVIERNKPFLLTFSYIFDYGMREFNGSWGIFVIDKNGERKSVLEIFDYDIPAGSAIYDKTGTQYVITSEIETGDRIRIFYSSDKVNWKPVRATSGIITELPLGIKIPVNNEKIAEHDEIIVSPTVAKNYIQIQSKNNIEINNIKLFDLAGKLKKEYHFSSKEQEISLSINDLPSGIYILSIETSNKIEKHKIIKK